MTKAEPSVPPSTEPKTAPEPQVEETEDVTPGDKENKVEETETLKAEEDYREQEIAAKIEAFENHAMRSQFLYRQKQAISAAEEADKLWWDNRQKYFRDMKARIETGYMTAQELNTFLKALMASQIAHEAQVQKICAFGTQDTGTLKQSSSAIMTMRKSSRQELDGLRNRVFKPCLTKADKFVKEMKTQVNAVRDKGDMLKSELELARKAMRKQWEKYESAMMRGMSLQIEGARLTLDPFIEGKRYDKATRDYRRAMNAFNSGSAKLQEELKYTDKRRLEKTKHILLEFFLAEKTKAQNRVKMLDASLEYIRSITPEDDVKQFLKQTINSNFSEYPSFSKAWARVTKLIYKDVVKWGDLSIPGRMFMSKWKQVHVIITKFGFFHYFSEKESLRPLASIWLSPDVLVAENPTDLTCFQITQPNYGFFSLLATPTVYTFKASSKDEAQKWVAMLRSIIDQQKR